MTSSRWRHQRKGRLSWWLSPAPIGPGKTTVTDLLRQQGYDLGEYINTDEITLELLKDNSSPPTQDLFQANRQTQQAPPQ